MFRLMGLLLVPYLIMEAVDIFVFSGVPHLTWQPYSLFLIVGIIITTPLQCAGEEYCVRGMVARVVGSYGSARVSFWIAATLSSVLFMLLHGAGDPYLNVFYFSFGMVASWMAWRTGGLEAGIALHVLNNLLSEATMPFTDISGMFDRSAGAANPITVVPVGFVLLACVGIVEWQVRRRKPATVAAPGAPQVEVGQFVPTAALQR
jgi:membrane protease YdiL (CAAX protease family)